MKIDRDDKKPLYRQAYEILRNSILNGEYKNVEYLPSERELGDLFEIDRITVRKALDLLVADKLVEKNPGLGTKIIKEELVNGSLFQGKNNKNILFLLPKENDRINEPFYATLLYNVEKECKKNGRYNLIYSTISEHEDYITIVNEKNISGVILVSNISEKLIEKSQLIDMPVALVNNYNSEIFSVIADNEKGAYDATNYLIELGHKDIALIRGIPNYLTTKERFNGWQRALIENNIDWRNQVIVDSNWKYDGGYEATKEILSQMRGSFSAIFCFNDMMALGSLQALREAGIDVPKDISVIGFDDIEQCQYTHPQLSTVKVDIPIMSKVVCQQLFNSIEAKQYLKVKVLIPTNLSIRNSTGLSKTK